MPILTNPYMLQAASAMQAMPTGWQTYGQQITGLGRQLGLAQRRATMQAGQLNIAPHLQFAIAQQQFPELYGQYGSALGSALGRAGQFDIQRAQTMGQFGTAAAQLALRERMIELARAQFRFQRQQAGIQNVIAGIGALGSLGGSIAGLAMGMPSTSPQVPYIQNPQIQPQYPSYVPQPIPY